MSDETVRATYCGPERIFPGLGILATPGERLEVPASLTDEYPGWWQRVYDPEEGQYVAADPEPTAKDEE